ncbi:MAG: hypothetical protein WAQ28_20155 [Bacteroidia bacterium]|jgi:lysophospholipase L1-like esterase
MKIFDKVYKRIKNKCLSNYFFDYIFIKKYGGFGPKIHVIGDSHVSVFSGIDTIQNAWPNKSTNIFPPFVSYRIGPVTAFNSYKKIQVFKKILTFKSSGVNKKMDYVMLCFGEIDIRVHLIKQKEIQGVDLEIIVEKCLKQYLLTIQAIANWGYNVIVFGPIASANKEIIIDNYSSYGSTKERNNATRLFNRSLESECKKMNVLFISFFEEMVDENENTKTEFLSDDIHLSAKTLPIIYEKLKKQLN